LTLNKNNKKKEYILLTAHTRNRREDLIGSDGIGEDQRQSIARRLNPPIGYIGYKAGRRAGVRARGRERGSHGEQRVGLIASRKIKRTRKISSSFRRRHDRHLSE